MSKLKTNLKVKQVLMPPDRVPVVEPTTILKSVLEQMSNLRLGIACVVDRNSKLIAVFTDGDVRRLLLSSQKPFAALFVDDIVVHANTSFASVSEKASLGEAVAIMEKKGIWDLPVVEKKGVFVGLLHLHPAIKAVMGL